MSKKGFMLTALSAALALGLASLPFASIARTAADSAYLQLAKQEGDHANKEKGEKAGKEEKDGKKGDKGKEGKEDKGGKEDKAGKSDKGDSKAADDNKGGGLEAHPMHNLMK